MSVKERPWGAQGWWRPVASPRQASVSRSVTGARSASHSATCVYWHLQVFSFLCLLTLRGFLLATVLRPCGWGLSPAACHLGSNTGSTWPAPPGRGRPRLLQGGSGPHASPFRSVPRARRRVETALLWLTTRGPASRSLNTHFLSFLFPFPSSCPFFPFSLWLIQLSFIVAYNLGKKNNRNFFSCNNLMSSELPNGFPCTLHISCKHIGRFNWF